MSFRVVQTHKWSNKKARISHRNKTLKSFDCQCVEYLVFESMLSDVYGTFSQIVQTYGMYVEFCTYKESRKQYKMRKSPSRGFYPIIRV
ncbi:hypothetical protein ANAPC1_00958 [Anaplasma phagocytophilum]|uniref:Uncharacterized protein n=1 Tax=Anaplasma phagocytophilum TaxID=948 RepID=A0AA45UU42_ANAPH|nr:hypothetical protein ANAPC1_00958 [Anaplasma phagocytophilum]SCV66262.1 hypothetical protein ANAPH2_01536 [Anaplasma phagocytophilum]